MVELKAMYSIAELATMANPSRCQMARMLKRGGFPVHEMGGKRWVYLSDLRKNLPSLWDSIQDVAG